MLATEMCLDDDSKVRVAIERNRNHIVG